MRQLAGLDLTLCSGRGQLHKMSALQTFLLVVDHNKEEAKQIAEQVAGGTLGVVSARLILDDADANTKS